MGNPSVIRQIQFSLLRSTLLKGGLAVLIAMSLGLASLLGWGVSVALAYVIESRVEALPYGIFPNYVLIRGQHLDDGFYRSNLDTGIVKAENSTAYGRGMVNVDLFSGKIRTYGQAGNGGLGTAYGRLQDEIFILPSSSPGHIFGPELFYVEYHFDGSKTAVGRSAVFDGSSLTITVSTSRGFSQIYTANLVAPALNDYCSGTMNVCIRGFFWVPMYPDDTMSLDMTVHLRAGTEWTIAQLGDYAQFTSLNTAGLNVIAPEGVKFGSKSGVFLTEQSPPTNAPPVCTAAQAFPSVLWEPNLRLVPITIMGVTDPEGDAVTLTVTGVTQDEPVKAVGDGNISPDAVIQAGAASVRAERSGTGNGRVYQVSFIAKDDKGGTCTGTVTVGVPHSLQKGLTAIDSGQAYDSTLP